MKPPLAGLVLAVGSLAYAGPASPPRVGETSGSADPAASTAPAPASAASPLATPLQAEIEPGHSFYFTRAVYSGGRGGRGFRGRGSWATDYPKADRQFLFILQRLLTRLDAYEWENPVRLDDPDLRRFTFLYALEVGYMNLTDAEVEGLRGYLEAGGFLVIDDFWGARQWANFEYNMSRVLPDRQIVELPLDHRVFHQFYDIEEVLTVPNVGNARRGGPYYECYPCPPRIFGIYDDEDRLMVVINFNTDLGDAWEWSEDPGYPFRESSYAYELAINYILYSMIY